MSPRARVQFVQKWMEVGPLSENEKELETVDIQTAVSGSVARGIGNAVFDEAPLEYGL
jgi:membrane protein YdbS with pleckstrin-like domain